MHGALDSTAGEVGVIGVRLRVAVTDGLSSDSDGAERPSGEYFGGDSSRVARGDVSAAPGDPTVAVRSRTRVDRAHDDLGKRLALEPATLQVSRFGNSLFELAGLVPVRRTVDANVLSSDRRVHDTTES